MMEKLIVPTVERTSVRALGGSRHPLPRIPTIYVKGIRTRQRQSHCRIKKDNVKHFRPTAAAIAETGPGDRIIFGVNKTTAGTMLRAENNCWPIEAPFPGPPQ
jgi:hypothetical protein